MAEDSQPGPKGSFRLHLISLGRLPLDHILVPEQPQKRINSGADVVPFLQSRGCRDILLFIFSLSRSLYPRPTAPGGDIVTWPTNAVYITVSPRVMRIKVLIQTLATLHKETPPETGPRRFGNAAFRTWYRKVEERLPALLQQALPENIWDHVAPSDRPLLKAELADYLLGSFGSPERLDYGTGHELSFLAFLTALWRLNGFALGELVSEERGVVVGVIEPYLELVRKLIKTYSLEPAGSHGVWGLDDHFFLPFILGAAQYSTPHWPLDPVPTEGSLQIAPQVSIVTNEQQVRALSSSNLFFAAVAFIYDVKKGPFWEHSPLIYDLTNVTGGWTKINRGLLKMYQAEVFAKFPVVQHLRFGSLIRWERDPSAPNPAATQHIASQPSSSAQASPSGAPPASQRATSQPSHATSASTSSGTIPPAVSAVTEKDDDPDSPSAGAPTKAPWAKIPGAARPPITAGRLPPVSVSTRILGSTARHTRIPSASRSRPYIFGDHASSTSTTSPKPELVPTVAGYSAFMAANPELRPSTAEATPAASTPKAMTAQAERPAISESAAQSDGCETESNVTPTATPGPSFTGGGETTSNAGPTT